MSSQEVAGTDRSRGFDLKESILIRCLRCYNIITIRLDVDGKLVSSNLEGKHHTCSNSNIINEPDEVTLSRLVDEVFLQLVRTHLRQARDLIYKIPVYKPTPVFLVHLSDILDDKIKYELTNLEAATRKQVLNDSIGRMFESIDEHYYNLNVRKMLKWEIVA